MNKLYVLWFLNSFGKRSVPQVKERHKNTRRNYCGANERVRIGLI